MHGAIRRIVIVGGGTAGWITACVIAAEHRNNVDRRLHISLIESPDIPIIGVGEGTWPSMRLTLQKIGLSEADLIRECGASFKQGTEFRAWSERGEEHRYYHPFSFPAEYASLNLARYWIEQRSRVAFADFVTPQAGIISAGKAPKQTTTPEYAFNVNYGYHLDAGRFARLLHTHAVNELGVHYISGNVEQVGSGDNGDISTVTLASGEQIAGDLFVDCTGQRALLIGEHFGVDFVSVKNTLFNDAAIAVQVPYTNVEQAVASVTRSTATDAGWIWDIGLHSRRGVGHVFSTAYTDVDSATAVARAYIAGVSPETNPDDLTYRHLSFEPGFRRELWVNNCVAVGLSAGFVEPLEASALALIEQSASLISQQMPANREIMAVVARRFNDKMSYHWGRLIEFLKLHYAISRRSDSDYWNDCRRPESCPDSLCDKLTLWKQQPPWHDDAPRVDELFPSASYQYVLYGMGFTPQYSFVPGMNPERERNRVDALLHGNSEMLRQMLNLLPSNRELVNAITASVNVA